MTNGLLERVRRNYETITRIKFLKRAKKVNLGKRTYEEEMEDLCNDYLISLLKKHITDETKTPLLVRGFKTFEDNGYTDRSRLTDEEDTLNFHLYVKCLSYTKNCANMINSDLKEETKIDLIVNDFVDGGIEELLYECMEEID